MKINDHFKYLTGTFNTSDSSDVTYSVDLFIPEGKIAKIISKIKDKTESNIIEVESRDAKVYLITNDENMPNHHFKYVVEKVSDYFQPVLIVPPLQLIGYYAALAKKLEIDKPRNLAKSVTVE